MAVVETRPYPTTLIKFTPFQAYLVTQVEALKKNLERYEQKERQYIGPVSDLGINFAQKLFAKAMFARWQELIDSGLSKEEADALTGRVPLSNENGVIKDKKIKRFRSTFSSR